MLPFSCVAVEIYCASNFDMFNILCMLVRCTILLSKNGYSRALKHKFIYFFAHKPTKLRGNTGKFSVPHRKYSTLSVKQ